MSYQALSRANFKCDTLKVTERTSCAVNDEWTIADSPIHTRATLSSGNITIYSGSHWLIEAKVGQMLYINSLSGEYRTQLYNGTSYVGFPAIMSNRDDLTASTNFSRALILSSDITTSMTLSIRCKSTTDTIVYWNKANGNEPICSIKIMEIPA